MGDGVPPSLSGAIVLRNLDAFRTEVGSRCVAKALQRLPSATRRQIDTLSPSAWVPVDVVDAAYAAIAQEAGRDLEEVYRRVVHQGVHKALQTVWRWLLRLTSDRALVSRTPVIYRRGHSTGELATAITAPGEARIELSGWPGIPHLRMVGVAGGVQATLEVAGRRDVTVTFEPAPDGASFIARWTP